MSSIILVASRVHDVAIYVGNYKQFGALAKSAAAAKSLQSCLTLCDPIDGSPPGPAVPRILQAITLEWVAISSSNEWKWKVKVKSLSHVRLLVTPWTAAHQAPPSMVFSRQEYWSGVPLPSPLAKSSVRQLVRKLEGSGAVRRESDGEIGEGFQPWCCR